MSVDGTRSADLCVCMQSFSKYNHGVKYLTSQRDRRVSMYVRAVVLSCLMPALD